MEVKHIEFKISPIFYMGNKKKLITKGLIDLFPDSIRHFYEPFAGSAIVSMNVKADKYYISDNNTNLYSLYNLFKTHTDSEIINHIEQRINSYGLARERTKRSQYKDKAKIEEYKRAYVKLRNQYNAIPNILDFYTLMFYSFSQQFRFNSKGQFNMPCGNDCFSDKNKEYIKNGCAFFSQNNVYVMNKDYRQLDIDEITSSDFVYLDPPYCGSTAVYNENNGWTREDDDSLFDFLIELNNKNIRWAMSNVFENKGIKNDKLIQWVDKNNFNVYLFNKFTYMACGKGNSNAKEVLITNY